MNPNVAQGVGAIISPTSPDVTAAPEYIGWYPMTQWTGAVGALTYDSITKSAVDSGSGGDVNNAGDYIGGVSAATWLTAGTLIKVRNSGGTIVSGLAVTTLYYAGKPTADRVTFHTTYADAIAGTNAIAISAGTSNVVIYPATLKDQSGQGNHMSICASTSDLVAWATAPYMGSASSGSVDNALGRLAVATLNAEWSWPTQSLFAFFRVKCGTLVVGRSIWGCGASSSVHGPRIALDSVDGDQATILFYGASATTTLGTTAAACFSTSVEHSIAIGFDASSLTGTAWIDGERDLTVSNISVSTVGTVLPTTDLRLGGATATNCQAAGFTDYHLMKFTGGLPTNIDDIVAKLHTSRYFRLRSGDV